MAAQIAKASPLALGWIKRVADAASTGANAGALEHQSDLLLRGGPDNMTRFTAATNRVTGRGGS